jgi:hypothetical protein
MASSGIEPRHSASTNYATVCPSLRRDDNIKMYFKEMDNEVVDCFNVRLGSSGGL